MPQQIFIIFLFFLLVVRLRCRFGRFRWWNRRWFHHRWLWRQLFGICTGRRLREEGLQRRKKSGKTDRKSTTSTGNFCNPRTPPFQLNPSNKPTAPLLHSLHFFHSQLLPPQPQRHPAPPARRRRPSNAEWPWLFAPRRALPPWRPWRQPGLLRSVQGRASGWSRSTWGDGEGPRCSWMSRDGFVRING